MDRDDYNIMLKTAMYNAREKQAISRAKVLSTMAGHMEQHSSIPNLRALITQGKKVTT